MNYFIDSDTAFSFPLARVEKVATDLTSNFHEVIQENSFRINAFTLRRMRRLHDRKLFISTFVCSLSLSCQLKKKIHFCCVPFRRFGNEGKLCLINFKLTISCLVPFLLRFHFSFSLNLLEYFIFFRKTIFPLTARKTTFLSCFPSSYFLFVIEELQCRIGVLIRFLP